jgi:hypothetical protein
MAHPGIPPAPPRQLKTVGERPSSRLSGLGVVRPRPSARAVVHVEGGGTPLVILKMGQPRSLVTATLPMDRDRARAKGRRVVAVVRGLRGMWRTLFRSGGGEFGPEDEQVSTPEKLARPLADVITHGPPRTWRGHTGSWIPGTPWPDLVALSGRGAWHTAVLDAVLSRTRKIRVAVVSPGPRSRWADEVIGLSAGVSARCGPDGEPGQWSSTRM